MLYLRLSDARNKTTTKDGIMEQKILEIIQENYNEFTGTNEAEIASSREITAHVFEFVEWLKSDCEGEYNCDRPDGLLWKVYLGYNKHLWFNTREVYEYWLTNVKE